MTRGERRALVIAALGLWQLWLIVKEYREGWA